MYYFIINPNSKSQMGIKLWKELKEQLLLNEISFREFITKAPEDAGKIVRQIEMRTKSEITIVVLGGDGTLHEVVSGITDFQRVKIGYIPTGSSNDFARGMKLSNDLDAVLKNLVEDCSVRKIDCGITSANDTSGRFLVSSGIGYDAKICHLANITKTKRRLNKLKLGKLTYIQIGLQGLMNFSLFDTEIIMDGKEMKFQDTLFISVHNLPFEGGGVKFAPKANPEDGYFDVCIVAGISKVRMLPLLPLAMKGKHVGHKGIYQFRCKSITIHTNKKQYFHMDGEVPKETDQMKVEVSKHKIQYI